MTQCLFSLLFLCSSSTHPSFLFLPSSSFVSIFAHSSCFLRPSRSVVPSEHWVNITTPDTRHFGHSQGRPLRFSIFPHSLLFFLPSLWPQSLSWPSPHHHPHHDLQSSQRIHVREQTQAFQQAHCHIITKNTCAGCWWFGWCDLVALPCNQQDFVPREPPEETRQGGQPSVYVSERIRCKAAQVVDGVPIVSFACLQRNQPHDTTIFWAWDTCEGMKKAILVFFPFSV